MSHPTSQLEEYRADFGQIEDEALALVESLTNDQFNWKPDDTRWSVGQCIDHLNRAGYELIPLLETAIQEGQARGITGEPPFRYNLVSRWFIGANEPSSNRKMKTFEVYEPGSSGLDPEATTERFAELQRALARKTEEANGLDLRRLKAPSPVSGLLRLNLGAWFEATIAHERRHLQQAHRVMQETGFPQA